MTTTKTNPTPNATAYLEARIQEYTDNLASAAASATWLSTQAQVGIVLGPCKDWIRRIEEAAEKLEALS